MFTNLNIQYRLILLFLLVGLLPTILGAALVVDRMTDTIKSNALNDLAGRRDSKQLAVEFWFETRVTNVEMLALSSIANSSIERLSTGSGDQELIDIRAQNERYFQRFSREYGFDEVLITDNNGLILFTTDTSRSANTHVANVSPSLKNAYEQAMFAGSFLTDLTREGDQQQRAFMYISSAVRSKDTQQVIGTVLARLPRETIALFMTERSGMGDTGDAFIVGEDRLARSELTASQNQQRGISDVLNTEIKSSAIRQAFSGVKSISEEVDYRDEDVLAGYTQLDIPHLRWALVVKIDLQEVLLPVSAMRTLLLLLALFVTGIVTVFGWIVARGFSEPITQLIAHADNIAQGKLDNDIEVSGKDEIASLSSSLLSVQDNLNDVTNAAADLASGQKVKNIPQRSDDDLLLISLNNFLSVSNAITSQANAVAEGDYLQKITPRSDEDALVISLNSMISSLYTNQCEMDDNNWLKEGVVKLNQIVLGERKLQALAERVLIGIADHMEIAAGAFFINNSKHDIDLQLFASYAYNYRKHGQTQFAGGEGLVGQAALEQKPLFIEKVTGQHLRLLSGLGESNAASINVFPIIFERQVVAVIEFATLKPLSEIQLSFIQSVSDAVATAFEVIQSREAIEKQQEKLQAMNDELVEQTENLRSTEQELLAQQDNLKQANSTLEQQTKALEQQTAELESSQAELEVQQSQVELVNEDLKAKNTELERQTIEMEETRRIVAMKADDLAVANRYKSEFLANMSHELRTPLNSLLLLAQNFHANENGNLTSEQINEAAIIYDSGSDLLNLINEILDLAKIEAGRIELRPEIVSIDELITSLQGQFKHMASSQGIDFLVTQSSDLPESIVTDPLRLGQIIKNLLSNALKFTENGEVSVSFDLIETDPSHTQPKSSEARLQVSVRDTGIGIPSDKHDAVFEAFQQLDTGDKRRYGGTGLGLSITRELVNLLGGKIDLQSEPGVGSTFIVNLPMTLDVDSTTEAPTHSNTSSLHETDLSDKKLQASSTTVLDDRMFIDDDDDSILIIEDDQSFQNILSAEITKRGYKSLIASSGEQGIELANRYLPTGIILDLHLPQMDGWSVLRKLKNNVDTRHIPVHIISCDDKTPLGMQIGAVGHLTKPVSNDDIADVIASIEHASGRDKKYVLLVEDDEQVRTETAKAIGNDTVSIIEADTGEKALSVMHDGGLDLVVLDLNLPDMQGIEILQRATAENYGLPPVIINTARELTDSEESILREYSETIVLKDVRSQERLVDEVALFLHRVVKYLPPEKKDIIQHLHKIDDPLIGKTVLIAEDDMRTLFVMTKIMTEFGMTPIKAENGQQAIEILSKNSDIDIVLMDMMMPIMDGYETMRTIRSDGNFDDLPIIALTAKAMREDRTKCIEAGASDYMTKPIQQDKLLSLMRVWLSR